MGNRGIRGIGSIRKTANGNYEGEATVHKEDKTSIRKSVTRRTEQEVKDILIRLKALEPVTNDTTKIEINKYTNEIKLVKNVQDKNSIDIKNNMTVVEYIDYYLWEHRRKGKKGKMVKETTFSSYLDKAELIKEELGNREIAKLTLEEIDTALQKIHKRVADTTARQTRDILVDMMRMAKKDGVIIENVLQDEQITFRENKGKKEKKILHLEDEERFIKYCVKNKHYEILMLLFTGARASEMAGMRWESLNLEEKTIKIDKEYIRVNEAYMENGKIKKRGTKKFTDLKTEDSYRTLGLQPEYVELLKQHKERQKQLAEILGKEFKETDWIFTTKKYEGYVADYTNDKFRKIVNTLKVRDYKELTTHCLRHTYCSRGIARGVEVHKMKELLGHSDIDVTVEWYLHLSDEEVVKASNKVTEDMAKHLIDKST